MGAITQTIDRPETARCTGHAWRVVHTKSRQEKAVAEYLEARGVHHFLPLVRHVRYYGRRKFTVATPLFPGYLFLRDTLDECYELDRTDRVARVIPVSDQDELQAELDQIRTAIEADAPLVSARFLEAGIAVEVRSGPFRGLRGVVEREAADDRLVLQVTMLGRAAQFEIDRSLLTPVA